MRLAAWKGNDFPLTIPLATGDDLPIVEMSVEETAHFTLGLTGRAQWASDVPETAGYGYCRLGPEDRVFALTMFHELHCLRILSEAFEHDKPDHVRHCLSYLRHGILCSADLTLEPGDALDRDFTHSRSGSTRLCRDWSVVYNAMERNWRNWSARQDTEYPM
ncbi:hypothetical protein AURDEDRAFT_136066 [Auricularia subglabra TFB-10046 SS5]|nr:hypothetical protein AURDEDRAFT_136066 [Auricularia subglabra TFB-10046 SS5]